MTKSIITSLTLKEISAVDRPAQVGAKMTIMKRADEEPIQKAAKSFVETLRERLEKEAEWKASDKLWPITSALTDAIGTTAADMSLTDEDKRSRIAADLAAFAEKMKEKVPDITSIITDITKSDPATAGFFMAGSTGSHPADTGDNPMADQKTVEGLQKSLDEVTKRAETAEAIAKMSDAEKAHMAKLSDEEKKAFMAMSKDDRAKVVTKAATDDETVVVEGETIAKSAVGPQQFAIIKAQAARIEQIEKSAAADRDSAQMVTLTKRAEDELANLPGEPVAKARVLKAVEAMGDEERATFTAMMKSANSALAKAFTLAGVKKGAEPDTIKKADDKVAEIMKRDNVSKSRAMEIAANEAPELFNQAAA